MTVLAPLAGPGRAEDGSFSRDEALVLARHALKSGDAGLANQIARRILAENPNDPLALLLIAATGPDLGEARIARLSGGAAWRNSTALPPALRYEIAYHTARAAMVEKRPAFAEYWLRRAIDMAPDAETRARSQSDLAALRANRPFGIRLGGTVTPSSNVNSGAGSSQFLIDGIHPVGTISSTGQELAGLRASLTAELLLRPIQRAKSRTEFGVYLLASRHWLSPEAQAKVDNDPMLVGQGRFTGADLDSTNLEARLRHGIAVQGLGSPVWFDLSVSQTWVPGAVGQPAVGMGMTLPVWTGADARLDLGLSARRQWHPFGAPTELIGLRLAGQAKWGPGQLQYSLSSGTQQRQSDVNSTFRQTSAEIGYQLDQTGPIRISGSLSLSIRDQDDYRLGPIAVTAGRHDRRIGLSISVGFPELTLMGLEPTLALQGQRGFSNLSRFNTNELALGLGLAARF